MVEEVLVEALEVILMVVNMVLVQQVLDLEHQAPPPNVEQSELYGQVTRDNSHQHVQQMNNYDQNN